MIINPHVDLLNQPDTLTCGSVRELADIINCFKAWLKEGANAVKDDDPWKWLTWRAQGLDNNDVQLLHSTFGNIQNLLAKLTDLNESSSPLFKDLSNILNQDYYIE